MWRYPGDWIWRRLTGDEWSAKNTMLTNQGVATGDESAEADVRYVKEAFQP